MKKLLLLTLPLLTALLLITACTENQTPVDTEDGTAETVTTPVTQAEVTVAGTEPDTEPETPSLPLTPDEPSVAENFAFSEVYHVEPHNESATVGVALQNGQRLTVSFDSTFYGTESAIDRDTL